MPPFNGMPYGPAPAYCFPLTEVCMYLLFLLCFIHAVKQGVTHISYLLGGLAFGLLLEYVNVISNMGYKYGKFMIMFGTAPLDIPLCIGMGWGVIMYTAWLFTNAFAPAAVGKRRFGYVAGDQHRFEYGYRGLPAAHVALELVWHPSQPVNSRLVRHTVWQLFRLGMRCFLLLFFYAFVAVVERS